jgi:hypothetical protein
LFLLSTRIPQFVLTGFSLPSILPKPPITRRKSSSSSTKQSAPINPIASKRVSFDLSNDSLGHHTEIVNLPTSQLPSDNLLGLVNTAAFPGQESSILSTQTQNGPDQPTAEQSLLSDTFFQSLLGFTSSIDPSPATTSSASLPMSFDDIFAVDNGTFFDFDQYFGTEQVNAGPAMASTPSAEPLPTQSATTYPESVPMSRAPSSESEGSALLDFDNNFDATFGLDLDLLTGGAPPAYDFNSGGAGDPTMAATFGSGFGLPPSPADMSDFAELLKGYPSTFSQEPNPTFISPAQLTASLQSTPDIPLVELPSMKRKMSESSETSLPKKRGRPCKNPLADVSSASPLVKPKRQASKPTVAKPKAVVPQKYLRDGTAQDILGMSEEKILAFPDFETLMLEVPAHLQTRAEDFGRLIENGRRQAAESAQMNRAAKDAKLTGLADKVQRMEAGFRQLLQQGLITEAMYRQFVTE